ncbi:MAG: hypothetical protein K2L64_02300 [Ureaplasma sp.]|nr:hypothetical protein [Ureaplasma sp.]
MSASIQNYIDSNNLFTYEQLNSKLNNNNFKSQIASTIGIDSNKIANISFDNNLLSINPYSSVNNRNKFVFSANIRELVKSCGNQKKGSYFLCYLTLNLI